MSQIRGFKSFNFFFFFVWKFKGKKDINIYILVHKSEQIDIKNGRNVNLVEAFQPSYAR